MDFGDPEGVGDDLSRLRRVAGEQDQAGDTEVTQLLDDGFGSGAHGVGDTEHADEVVVVGQADHRLTAGAQPFGPAPGVLGEVDPVLAQKGGAADEEAGAVEFGPHPHPEDDFARLVDRHVQVLLLGAGDDRLGERVACVQFAGGGQAEHLVGGDRLTEGHHARDQGAAGRR